jgi:tellurite resistance protein TerC
VVTQKESLCWTAFWFSLAVLFGLYILYAQGPQKAFEFSAGYILELSLSMDNVFVFVLLFKRFAIPKILQHRVLFWGVLGALVMRAVMIIVGVQLMNNFSWMIYIFGLFLLFTSIKMLKSIPDETDIGEPYISKALRKYLPVTRELHGEQFFVRQHAKWYITPLFIVLVLIEASDLVFALDSIPAIFAITTDPFIVYTSNCFAIMGLRSLYFAIAEMIDKFKGLHYGLSLILGFVGIKMLCSGFFHFPAWATLCFIVVTLVGSLLISFFYRLKTESTKRLK